MQSASCSRCRFESGLPGSVAGVPANAVQLVPGRVVAAVGEGGERVCATSEHPAEQEDGIGDSKQAGIICICAVEAAELGGLEEVGEDADSIADAVASISITVAAQKGADVRAVVVRAGGC